MSEFEGSPRCNHIARDLNPPRALVDILVADFGIERRVANLLDCRDVHSMVATVARSQYLARTEARLLLEEFPPAARVPLHRTRGFFYTLWVVVAVMFSIALFIICSPVWRTFT